MMAAVVHDVIQSLTLLQGVVAFLPSFSFAEQAEQRWTASGGLALLAALKQVFWEPREASRLEPVLQAYSAAAQGELPCGTYQRHA